MIDFGNCETLIKDTKIVLKEKQSKITFINNDKQNIRKIIIDNCFIKEGIRCDNLLILSNNIEIFVELKGCDVEHAIKQIERTIEIASMDKKEQKKISFIVSTRNPLTGADIQNYKVQFKKKYKSDLIFKNSPCEYKIQ